MLLWPVKCCTVPRPAPSITRRLAKVWHKQCQEKFESLPPDCSSVELGKVNVEIEVAPALAFALGIKLSGLIRQAE